MNRQALHTTSLLLLALVFTIGLSFATVELPYIVDGFLQEAVTTPGFDSHASEISELKTELFIAHYRLRLIGYVCFALTVALIIVGFATRRTGLATVGALAFMLPVFAQFAGVMFFLAGLGALNLLWLPVLDISFELQRLGLIIRAPYDGLMWLFRQVGVNGYWPIVYTFLGGGLLLFFLGTYAWLAARARQRQVASLWVYRISRHPQYLGWILWSYGVYLLLLRGLYPRRSWGIDASLPWLVSTLVIVGVAMMEELKMRQRHGQEYEAYRRRAPFLFPLPAFLRNAFTLPSRILFGKAEPQRRREVAAVLAVYAAVLISTSVLFYGGGWERFGSLLAPSRRQAEIETLATQLENAQSARTQFFLVERLAAFGDPAVDQLLPMLEHERAEVRELAAEYLGRIPSERAVAPLLEMLEDPVVMVRVKAARSLGVLGDREAAEPLLRLLDDPDAWVRTSAMRSLSVLGVEEIVERAAPPLADPERWIRASTLESLGILGSETALPLVVEALHDEEPFVRRTAVVAVLKIGSLRARDALEQALLDEDWEVRLYAAEALKQLAPP
jgi:protein-S-isoprenylcysteine O-methyltransferase Ste14